MLKNFTGKLLIELLFVIAIISIIAAAVFGTLRSGAEENAELPDEPVNVADNTGSAAAPENDLAGNSSEDEITEPLDPIEEDSEAANPEDDQIEPESTPDPWNGWIPKNPTPTPTPKDEDEDVPGDEDKDVPGEEDEDVPGDGDKEVPGEEDEDVPGDGDEEVPGEGVPAAK